MKNFVIYIDVRSHMDSGMCTWFTIQDGGRQEEEEVTKNFCFILRRRDGDQYLNDRYVFDRRLRDMDAEEFMMHGFDSDVCDDDDEHMDAEHDPQTEVSSQQHTK